tara:strand:+ start:59 stop:460 length:402 start_codon:yes stop_codon:yes gene_type:complete
MNRFYVLVGSNIDPQNNVKKGLQLIEKCDAIELEAVSSEFISEAVGMDGNNFLNQALRCTTKQDFRNTISTLKDIEAACGRKRDPNNKFTSRTLDLDIIHWNDFKGSIEGYQLPDPDIEKFDYIKSPLSEVLV